MSKQINTIVELDKEKQHSPKQVSKLGLWSCTALVVGNMVGSGIFLLPSTLAPYGVIAIFGWIATSAGAIVLALVFGRLARMAPRTGGPYAWSHDAFGEFVGFLNAWGYWIALWAGNAAVAIAFSGYLSYLFPALLESNIVRFGTALAAIWIVTFVNVRSVKNAGSFQIVTTVLKLLPLLFIIALGFSDFQIDNFVSPPSPSPHGGTGAAVVATAALTLWAFLGLESATVPAGDVENASKIIPLATIMGVAFTAVLYILVTVAVFGLMPLENLAQSSAPLADAARLAVGNWGGITVAVGACVATIGTLNGFTLLSGQIPFAAARDNVFPSWFGKVNAQGAPARGLIVSNILASCLVAMNFTKGLVEQFTFIILLATLTTLVPYIFCALAEIMIVLKKADGARRSSALTFILGGIAFLYSIWAIYGAGSEIVFYGFLLLLAGIPVHMAIKYHAAMQRIAPISGDKK
ncbi:MAG: amino acid permease [Kordiimonadaceae bacterium]|nr:amino acid permease [Kordiimonadaceae bacterium]